MVKPGFEHSLTTEPGSWRAGTELVYSLKMSHVIKYAWFHHAHLLFGILICVSPLTNVFKGLGGL